MKKYSTLSVPKTRVVNSKKSAKKILSTLVSNGDGDLNDYIKDSLKSTSSLREKARRLQTKREKIQEQFLRSERVGEGLFGSDEIEMFTRAAAYEQAEKWVDEGEFLDLSLSLSLSLYGFKQSRRKNVDKKKEKRT